MSGTAKLTLALPSKGRLREAAEAMFARAGFEIVKTGSARGYQGEVRGVNGLDVAFLSASEIARSLKDGTVDLGVTGEDLLRETISPDDPVADVVLRLGFGPADVVVAVPECWLDVATVADLDQVAGEIYATHGHRLRVATKYLELTRRFFARARSDRIPDR
jgi:ATP phosphoribosyltransferase